MCLVETFKPKKKRESIFVVIGLKSPLFATLYGFENNCAHQALRGVGPVWCDNGCFNCSHANARTTGSRMRGGGRTVYEKRARAGSSSSSHRRSNAPLPPHPFVVTQPSQPGYVCYRVFIVFMSEREIMTIAKHPQGHSHTAKKTHAGKGALL